MEIKIKKYKHSPDITSKVYSEKIGQHKFEANLFEDNGGELKAKIGEDHLISRQDAKLKDWIDDTQQMCYFYHNLLVFLTEVKHLHDQNNK